LLKYRLFLFIHFLRFSIFYFIQMAAQSSSSKKSAGGRISTKTPGIVYSKTAYYFPEHLIELLQYIGMVLRKRASPLNSTQATMEEGLTRQIRALCKEKNIIIPEDLLPTDDSDLCTKLRNLNTTNAAILATATAAGSGS
jgi:hypothetical protein